MLNRGDVKNRLSPTYYRALQHAQIHSKFHKKRLSSLIDTASGGTPSKNKPEYWAGNIGWISPKDVKDFYIQSAEDSISQQAIDDSSTKLVPAGSVVIVVRSGILAHTLPVSVLSKELAINQDIKALLVKSDDVLPDYLAVFLTIFQKRLLPVITKHSTTVQSVNSYEFLRLEIACPPESIQASIIELFQNALKQKRQQEAQAQSLLDSIGGYLLGELGIKLPLKPENTIENRMFKTSWQQVSGGRFDPEHTKPYYQQLVLSIQSKPHKRLHEVSRFSQETWNQSQFFKDTFPYLEISGLNISTGEIEEVSLVAVDEAPSRAKMTIRRGDLVISTTRPGRGAIAIFNQDEMCVGSTGFAIIRKTFNVSRAFLHLLLRSKLCLRQMEQRSSGGNYPAITQEELGQIWIPTPPIDLQERIAHHINAIRQQAQMLRRQAQDDFARAKQEIERLILG